MKFKCIKSDELAGLFLNKIEEIEGITKGSEYFGQLVSVTNGSLGGTFEISSNSTRLIIFDDNGKWVSHDPKLFVPVLG